MGQFALPLAILSAGFQAYSAFSGAAAQKAQARAQSQIAANNAIVAENNAKYQERLASDAIRRGNEEKEQIRRKISQLEGSQRASFAGAGVTLDTGSPLDILSDTNELGNRDVKTALENAKREEYGYRMGAYNYRATGQNSLAESSMYSATAKSISPAMSAAGSALSSAGSISSKWDTFGGGGNSSANYYSSGYYNPGTYNPTAANNGLPWSDIRLKHSIVHVGEEKGHRIYEFSYKGDDRRYRGVIAQEVQKINKRAVYRRGPYFCVDYNELGIEFREVA